MGLFSRRERNDHTYPFLTAAQAEAMYAAARAAIADAGLAGVVGDGEAVLESGGVIGFDNLSRSIAELPASSPELSAICGHYVASVIASMTAEREPITEAVLSQRGYLRLVDGTSIPPAIEDGYGYAERIGDRAIAIIALDEPHTVRTVPSQDLADVGIERARQIGYVNLVNDARYERESVEVDGGTVHSLSGPSMFVGSRLLVLQEELARLGVDAPHGVVAIAPDRHHLHFHVIVDIGVVPVINLLQNVALNAYNDEQGAISPCVYWWHEDAFTQLTRLGEDGTVSIEISAELTEVLNSLA